MVTSREIGRGRGQHRLRSWGQAWQQSLRLPLSPTGSPRAWQTFSTATRNPRPGAPPGATQWLTPLASGGPGQGQWCWQCPPQTQHCREMVTFQTAINFLFSRLIYSISRACASGCNSHAAARALEARAVGGPGAGNGERTRPWLGQWTGNPGRPPRGGEHGAEHCRGW